MTIQSIATSDFQGLNELKIQAKNNAKEALPEVAKQFEAIFLQSMLKSMRMGQHFLDESSPFSGKNEVAFQEMLDAQYASTIAGSKGIGLASLLAKQLEVSVGDKAKNPVHLSTEVNNTKVINSEESVSVVDDFVKSVWPTAKQAASLIGLDPKLLIAQAALETGWGKFVTRDAEGSSSNNLFNIKTGSNSKVESIQVKTTEYIADTPIKINAS
ncbi:TPA: rod-binding protein, partial [Legionella pneumophila]|nr:rod-binding protein [Legionella pneumophila]